MPERDDRSRRSRRFSSVGRDVVEFTMQATPSAADAFSSSTSSSTPEIAGPATDGVHGNGQFGGGLLIEPKPIRCSCIIVAPRMSVGEMSFRTVRMIAPRGKLTLLLAVSHPA